MRSRRGQAPRMTQRRIVTSCVLLFAVTLAYAANGRTIGSGDTLPARYLPWSLLLRQSFELDEFPFLYGEDTRRTFPLLEGVPYFLRVRRGHYLSAYGPGAAVAALPVYAIPVLAGVSPTSDWAARLEKLAAALITSASVVLVFWALRLLVDGRWALGIALIYAFGTSSLSVSSQGLWQHGPSQLLLSLLIYCVVKGLRDERYVGPAAFAMAGAVAMRSTDILLVLPIALWTLFTHRTLIPRLALWAAPPLFGLALYNWVWLGSLTGGSETTTAPLWSLFAQVPLREGFDGLLWSPSRGLFVYSPILLFSIPGCVAVWRRGPSALKALSLGLPLLVLVLSKWFLWWGGHTWGPRLLADAAPLFSFFLYPLTNLLDRRRILKALFVFLALLSVGAHAMGAFLYDGRWDGIAEAEDDDALLWSWKRSPLVFYGAQAAAAIRHAISPAAQALFTSARSPEMLAASYTVEPIGHSVHTDEPVVVSLVARNTGRAVWLANAPDRRGTVGLGWRWYRGDHEGWSGRAVLSSDVPPGGTARFRVRIPAPANPGEYTLVLDLVSEGVSWFAERGQPALKTEVKVRPLDMTRALSEPVPASSLARAAIATDRDSYRRDDVLHLAVDLTGPPQPRRFDAYLIITTPDGGAIFYDGRSRAAATKENWVPWVKRLPLPARVTGRFDLPLAGLAPGGLPPGLYVWHVALTEPGTHHILARAGAPFTITP